MRVASLFAVAVLYAARPAEAAGVAKLGVSSIATPQTAGSVSTVRVEARTSSGAIVTTYSGTIRFTSTDARAVLPANYTFTTADQGAHVFTNGVTLKTPGTQSVTATDTTTTAITGSQTGVVVNPGPAATLVLSGIPTPLTPVGYAPMTVELLDSLANRATGYRGTVHFDVDAHADGSLPVTWGLPSDYAFTAGDSGIHTFPSGVRIDTAGTWTVTATDTTSPSLRGAQTVQVNPGSPAQILVSGVASPTTAAFPTNATVEVRDQFSNRVTGYRGTVHFSSSDGQALLPANYAFTSADGGIHTFSGAVTLKTVGTQTVTVTDIATPSLTGTQSGIQVVTNDAVSLSVFGLLSPPGPVIAGTVRTVTVTARDAALNPAQGYSGTVRFTSTDAQADLPADYTFTSGAQCGSTPCDNGSHQFSVTLRTSCRGENCFNFSLSTPSKIQTVTAQDIVSSSIRGSALPSVSPADAAVIAVFGFPSVVVAGDVQSFVLQAQDAYGNAAVRSGDATVTFSDPQVPPMTLPITTYWQRWSAWLLSPGLQSISATDGILPALPQTQV